jgi:hypothetical protein
MDIMCQMKFVTLFQQPILIVLTVRCLDQALHAQHAYQHIIWIQQDNV